MSGTESIRIITRKGDAFIIDKDDYCLVCKFNWYIHKTRSKRYPATYLGPRSSRKRITMHRFLLQIADPKILVDHVNGDGLDNRRSNLRLTNFAGNAQNARKRRDGKSSKYKGVYKRTSGRFIAYIQLNGKKMWLGTYDTEEQAAEAYNIKAKELFKEFAYLNPVGEDSGR